ncbi:2-keto-4-pentenoate hydratase [Sphingorhabdus arenilitoris]|uniref:2-keto-4-pentenoate hydratase n=1 Tax=Sphingorhabdus arenilitoris TaxID=1490041 RepID=A0ABV8RHE8_9SPHN
MGAEDMLSSISSALVQARRQAVALDGFPGALPVTLEAAYDVQARSRHIWTDQVGGWKVGGVPAAYLDKFDETRLAGPIFRKNILTANWGEVTSMPVYPGFAAVEGELVFCLGEDEQDDRLHVGVEIASSPLPAINDMGPIAVICDFGNNGGLILGPEIEDWRSYKPSVFKVVTEIEGGIVGQTEMRNFGEDALVALAFMRRHAKQYGIDLPAGTYVSTGAITGVHETAAGSRSEVSFGDLGTLRIHLVPAEPMP